MKGLKLIGKGSFTECFMNADNVTVTLVSVDPIKECMAHGWFPDSDLFPKVSFSNKDCNSGAQVYEMEYYPKVSSLKNSLDADQYKIYKTLRKLTVDCVGKKRSQYSKWFDAFSSLEDSDLKETMIEALDGCTNYGDDVSFEISPRNVAVKNGKLVLLDCFFLTSELKKVRRK